MSRKPSKTTSRDRLRPNPPPVARGQTSKPSIGSARSSTISAGRASQKSSTGSRPGAIEAKPVSSKPSVSAPPKEVKEWTLPALSVPFKPKVTTSELQKMKKRTIRRNAPPGEDLTHIKSILRSIRNQTITVNEFISLIAPSTGDRGEIMRKVMNDDLNSFRKLARKVYETITKDSSDVLLNQQLQLAEYYKERKGLYHDKMMRLIEEIYLMAPNFDFERYSKEKEKYLNEVIPLPDEVNLEPEEFEMMKRQAAFHRLQWLRSEGERLNEENNSLKKRLNQLKRSHKEEQARMLQMEQEAEAKRQELEATEAEKTEELEKLYDSLEDSIIEKEKDIRIDKDKVILEPVPKKQAPKKKKSKGAMKKIRRPPWNEAAARELEGQALDRSEIADTSRATSPFHFSPIKTPPRRPAAAREVSPFHFSPPRYEEARYVSPPRQQAPPTQQAPPPQRVGRRAAAPRDTWGGFY